MKAKREDPVLRVLTAAAFVLMIAVNVLAEVLPINGVTTAEVADAYPNLFTPAPVTFAIWGLIYLLLFAYTLYQLGLFRGYNRKSNTELLHSVNVAFAVSCVANAGWILVWHYYKILLSVLLMAVILLCLIFINRVVSKETLSGRERFFIRLPFSVYFGWITVAAVANVTAFLVSIGWDGFGLAPSAWTVLVLLAVLLLGGYTTVISKSFAYGAVLFWAYLGILFRHLSRTGFSGEYPAVIGTVFLCLGVLAICLIFVLMSARRPRGRLIRRLY